jgi:hypothetical protein
VPSKFPNVGQSLADLYPEVAAQADGWDPTTLKAGSNKKMPWKCEQGHTWETSVNNRSSGKNCPVCAGQKTLAGFNDLATTNPELAAQAHGWDPTTLMPFTSKKVSWICEVGHIWEATVGSRSAGNRCPTCAGRIPVVGKDDFATTHPELAAQAHGWDPTTLKAGSDRIVSWKCSESHTWNARISNRVRNSSCATCRGDQVLTGFNDLATTHPELAAQAYGWDPTVVSARNKSGSHFSWICKLQHTWEATLSNRIKGTGCPICVGQKTLAGYNDLATTNPELAAQADGWDPTTLLAFSNRKVKWICQLGHRWEAAVNSRSSGSGCPTCGGKRVLVGFNDLATTNPELAAQAHGWDPKTVTAGSGRRLEWKCPQGHVWKTAVGDRTRPDGTICPSCSIYGFDPNKDGWLYFIDHDGLSMLQVGISNLPDTRISQHSKRGWEVLEIRGPMKGQLAQELETAILHAVERRGAILGHKAGIEKFDGYSEAWTKDSLDVSSFKQLLDWVYEDDHPEAGA